LLNKLVYVIILAAAMCLLACGACAQLIPTSFGFPVIVQSANSVAFNQDTAEALCFEDVSIDFPVTGAGLPFGAVSLAFPSIHQTSLQTQSVTHTSFVQTSEFAEFAFPFVGVGAGVLPGFGLGF
jgi:hypothetical protein